MNAFFQHSWTKLIAIPLVFTGLISNGNPLGESVRVGEVQFERTADALRILQGSDKAIIDWESFSISASEITEFVQPGTNSAALNRVRGLSASQIDGALRANGRIVLINPNGIIIGPSGNVDVAGFIASTLDISDSEFLAGGDVTFTGSSQKGIVNLGTISATGGDVFLIAATVENSGKINAPDGTVGLAAGNDVLLKDSNTSGERIFIRGASGGNKATGVVNKGAINANIAELKAHGGNVYALAVKNEGRIAATGVSKVGGQIFLRAGGAGSKIQNTGTLKATRQDGSGGRIEIDAGPDGEVENSGTVDTSSDSGKGGEIFILGSQIALEPGSLVISDGATGGGEIFIGGGRRGQDQELMNAENVEVSDGAFISANATSNGDGGQIVVYTENRLDFSGMVSATGGPTGGNGGFVELSGKNEVIIPNLSGRVSLGAINGNSGTLLFDPEDITIIDSASIMPIGGSPVNSNTLADTDINAFLAGASLIIETTATGTGPGNITVSDNVELLWTSSSSLTFNATGDFILNGGISGARIDSQGSGAVTINAGNTIDISGDIESGSGDIMLDAAGNVIVGGGSITTSGSIQIDSGQTVTFDNGAITGSGIGETIGIDGLRGIQLINGSQISATGSTNVVLKGNDGMIPTSGAFEGVYLDNSSITSTDGNISLTGIGGDTGMAVKGIHLMNNSLIESTGIGEIFLKGTAGAGAGFGEGIGVFSSTIRSNSGGLTLEGTGGSNTMSTSAIGVLVSDSTIESTADGKIAITGIGGQGSDAHGVRLDTSMVRSVNGNVEINAQSGSGTGGIGFDSFSTTIGQPTATGDITIQTNSIRLASSSLQSSGNLVITPTDPTADINIGQGASDTSLQLDENEVASFVDGFNSITIGDSMNGSGTINISEVTFTDPLTIAAPGSTGSIVVTGNLTGSDNASITFVGSGTTTYLSANILTDGNEIIIQDNVVLQGNSFLDTTNSGDFVNGADVTIEGTVDGNMASHNFGINAGTNGLIDLQGAVGSSSSLGDINFSSSKLDLSVSLNAFGAVDITTTAGFRNTASGTINSDGQITINANQGGMPNTGDFHGIEVLGEINSSEAGVTLNGTGGNTVGNFGVWIESGTGVSGSSNVSINGMAQNSADAGVLIDAPVSSLNSGVEITTDGGHIEINNSVTTPAGVSLNGAATEDTEFIITSGLQIAGLTVDGVGGSNNVLNFSDFGGQIDLSADQLTNLQTLIGGTNSNDTFSGSSEFADYVFDGPDEFSYTGKTSGEAINISGFENVTGAGLMSMGMPPAGNFFDFQPGGGLSGNLDGGAGNQINTLSYADFDAPVMVDLAAGEATAIGGTISNFADFIGSADTNNQFIFSDNPNLIQITGINEFESTGFFQADGFGNLMGGTSSDIFQFLSGGAITGNLSGGGGQQIDTINYDQFGSAIEINLETKTATGIGGVFDEITNFIGSGETDDNIILSDDADVVDIFGDNSGTVNNTETFSEIENIDGGAGSDQFNFNGLYTFAGMIRGGAGRDSLNIFTDPSSMATTGPTPNRNVFISEGRISINPVWNFTSFGTVGVTTGGGNDTFTTQFTSFRQNLNGSGGIDTLNFSQAPFGSPSPVTRSGAGPVYYRGFEILNFAPPPPDPGPNPADPPADNPTADTGGILQLQLDVVDQSNAPDNDGGITMQPFVDGTNASGIGALQNALGAFGAFSQQGVIFAGLDSGAIFIVPFSLDGSGIQPSNFGIQLLRESLAPEANSELLAALGLDRGIFLIEGDGPFALDLSGFPTLEATLRALLEQLSPNSHAELQGALDIVVIVLLTPADGPVALAANGEQPGQVSVILLNELLGEEALNELNAALGIQ